VRSEQADGGGSGNPPILVPELRDYSQINAELVRRLNLGQTHVRLTGVAGQRLLAAGLVGPWHAKVDVEGGAGPELAAGMNAPNITLHCLGTAADGCGSGFLAGRLLVLRSVGVALGYFQRGGMIVAAGDVAARAGLCQQGGDLLLLGRTGPLAGERQSGGCLFLQESLTGPHAGRGARGGQRIDFDLCLADRVKLLLDHQLVLDEAIRLASAFGAFFSEECTR
jgi:methylamine---glutamate N-methyltransferase subunit B